MPIKAQSLAERATATARVDYGELGDLNVTFYPGKFSIGFLNRISAVSTADQFQGVLGEFCEIVTAWDLLGRGGKPLPVTVETASDQGVDVITDIVMAIGGALRPSPATSTAPSGQ